MNRLAFWGWSIAAAYGLITGQVGKAVVCLLFALMNRAFIIERRINKLATKLRKDGHK